jgi:hypothetical protein
MGVGTGLFLSVTLTAASWPAKRNFLDLGRILLDKWKMLRLLLRTTRQQATGIRPPYSQRGLTFCQRQSIRHSLYKNATVFHRSPPPTPSPPPPPCRFITTNTESTLSHQLRHLQLTTYVNILVANIICVYNMPIWF